MILVVISALMLTAGPAQALSCLRPDVVDLYENARDSEAVYSMVRGRLHYAQPPTRPVPDPRGQKNARADSTVRLSGMGLGETGFDVPFDRAVTLSLTCIGPWCAGVPGADSEVFVALRHENGDLVLEQAACHANAIPATPEDEARLLDCHRTGRCVSMNGF